MTIRVKTGGRKKGTPNKVSKDRRELIRAGVNKRLPRLFAEIDKLTNQKDFFWAMFKLMEYVYPKLQSKEYEEEAPPFDFKSELERMMEMEDDFHLTRPE